MNTLRLTLPLLGLLAISSPSHALYVCEDAQGYRSFTPEPCTGATPAWNPQPLRSTALLGGSVQDQLARQHEDLHSLRNELRAEAETGRFQAQAWSYQP